ncbi:MAG: hypothetical protein PHG08_02345 [Bacilli bacterium]|jgi:hypothetical protein|nr:hypothetical protein [Bacilli bacterium]HHU23799.1 hypothetical protein [Acholeplasmataceae bacterium]
MVTFKAHVDTITEKVNEFEKYSQTIFEKTSYVIAELQKEGIKEQLERFSDELEKIGKELNNIIYENNQKNYQK